jgi:hypothetical protein
MKNGGKPIGNPVVMLREEFDDRAILFDPDTGHGFGLNPPASTRGSSLTGSNQPIRCSWLCAGTPKMYLKMAKVDPNPRETTSIYLSHSSPTTPLTMILQVTPALPFFRSQWDRNEPSGY